MFDRVLSVFCLIMIGNESIETILAIVEQSLFDKFSSRDHSSDCSRYNLSVLIYFVVKLYLLVSYPSWLSGKALDKLNRHIQLCIDKIDSPLSEPSNEMSEVSKDRQEAIKDWRESRIQLTEASKERKGPLRKASNERQDAVKERQELGNRMNELENRMSGLENRLQKMDESVEKLLALQK